MCLRCLRRVSCRGAFKHVKKLEEASPNPNPNPNPNPAEHVKKLEEEVAAAKAHAQQAEADMQASQKATVATQRRLEYMKSLRSLDDLIDVCWG